MNEQNNTLTLILFINSVLIIGLVLNQNETKQESVNQKTKSSASNPLENFTWIFVISEFILLLIKGKISDS